MSCFRRGLPLFLILLLFACTTKSTTPEIDPVSGSKGEDGIRFDLGTPPEVVEQAAMSGVESKESEALIVDPRPGELILVDRGDWQDWRLKRPQQAGTDNYGKWLDFEPLDNEARSPEFRGTHMIRARFQIYFPPRFPFYTQLEEEDRATNLFALTSTDDESEGPFVSLGVNLSADSMWRVHARYRDALGEEHDSGDEFMIPWAFEHGWNQVIWVVVLREPGAHDDALRIQIGSKTFAWTGLDLSGAGDPLRFFKLGSWDVPRGDRHVYLRLLRVEDLAPRNDPDPLPDPLPPPPPPPPAGTVLYEQDFEGSDPFRGWLGRNASSNLQVIDQGENRIGRLVYEPHSDWLVSFLPRRQGVMDLEAEYSVRLPVGFRYKRDENGQIIGGGKHFWQLTSINRYLGETMDADGRTRLDFGAASDFGDWNITAYRNTVGGGRPGEFAMWFARGDYFTPGRWHRVRCRVHINPGPGDNSGRLELWIDDRHLGTFGGEFNVVGPTGGIRVLGFGNLDNIEGAPWVEVDDIRIVAR